MDRSETEAANGDLTTLRDSFRHQRPDVSDADFAAAVEACMGTVDPSRSREQLLACVKERLGFG
jgi:hypothetical protein